MKKNYLVTPGFLAALLILLLNDFYFKYAFPGFVTGKLSDFAGLFLFPLFFSEFFPKKKILIYITTAITFILWKMPLADNFINIWNSMFFLKISRVVDYTDYLALCVLPFSYYYKTKSLKLSFPRTIRFAVFGLTLFAIIATAGTMGNVKKYSYSFSKSEVNKAIKIFFAKNPKYIVPKEYQFYTFYYDSTKPPEKWSFENNMQIFSFHFYIEKDNPYIIWADFEEDNDYWYKKKCRLALIGYIEPNKKWKFNHLMTREEKRWIKKLFENEILLKINKILESQ